MPQLRVLLGFASAPDNALDELAGAVLQKLYGNAIYPTPPVTSVALTTAKNDFSAAVAAANLGGPGDTAIKNNKREDLVDLLRKLAVYVQERHENDLANLLSSGFDAVSTNRASSPLAPPHIKDITNGNTGQLVLRVTVVTNAKCYEVRSALVGPNGTLGPWQTGGLFTNSRSMAVGGLTPGTVYQFQVRAVGGSTGYSDWSDPVSHMSM